MNDKKKDETGSVHTFLHSTLPAIFAIVGLCMWALIVVFLVALTTFSRVIRPITPHGTLTEAPYVSIGAPSAWAVIACIALVIMCSLVSQYLSRYNKRTVLTGLLIWVFIAQIVWIASVCLIFSFYSDTQSLVNAASAIITDQTRYFGIDACPKLRSMRPGVCIPVRLHTYFSEYPFQAGPALWMTLIFRIFGVRNIVSFQIINALMIVGIVWVLWRLTEQIALSRDEEGRAQRVVMSAFAIFAATCVPLLTFATFVYPNMAGLFFVLMGIEMLRTSLTQVSCARKFWSAFSACLLIGVGVAIKSTFIIFALAIVVAVFVVSLISRGWWNMLSALAAAASAKAMPALSEKLFGLITTQNFGKGMPLNLWLYLGLKHANLRHDGHPAGWWDLGMAQLYYGAGKGNHDVAAHAAWLEIGKEIHALLQPGHAGSFFTRKLASEWADSTFMTSYYSQLGISAWGRSAPAQWLIFGAGHDGWFGFQDIHESLVVICAALGVICLLTTVCRKATHHDVSSVSFELIWIVASFVGGFLCYVLWEAKGIYTLPFYIFLLPCAGVGLYYIQLMAQRVGCWVKERIIQTLSWQS
ncbi:hypothetical protein ACFQY8_03860 [Alloscardovia venturai]|uniref:Glycosyltransferase RgtA/B/C/D-like domain-containing protein n=1 Tax=Alloscardovia venturai TaxID=1769421 RepID=A0ABW2Y561_9BIFI